SHYARITVAGEGLRLHYALDHAEIPAFQERQAMDGNHDGEVTRIEEETYLEHKVPALLHGLSLKLDGRPAPLVPLAQRLTWAPGAGGLRTLGIDIEARATANSGWHTVEYRDANLPTRAG